MSRIISDAERLDMFMKKVNKQGPVMYEHLGPCWEWQGIKKEGYGHYSNNKAHRLSYELHTKSKIKEKMCIMHLCDNRGCVNPEHLQEGTIQDNNLDMKKKNKCNSGNVPRNLCSNLKLQKEDLEFIKNSSMSDKELSEKYSISKKHLNCVRNKLKKNSINIESYITISKEDYFWSRAIHKKVINNKELGECWETLYDRHLIYYEGKQQLAYRIAYKIRYGEIPVDKNSVRHKCDNGKCINPDHLEIGSHQDNMNDARERKRFKYGSTNPNSKLTDLEVIDIYNSKGHIKRSDLAIKYNVCPECISHIWNKHTYKIILDKLEY